MTLVSFFWIVNTTNKLTIWFTATVLHTLSVTRETFLFSLDNNAHAGTKNSHQRKSRNSKKKRKAKENKKK